MGFIKVNGGGSYRYPFAHPPHQVVAYADRASAPDRTWSRRARASRASCFDGRMTTRRQPLRSRPPQPLSPADEKLWATLIHVGGILFGFLPR